MSEEQNLRLIERLVAALREAQPWLRRYRDAVNMGAEHYDSFRNAETTVVDAIAEHAKWQAQRRW